ncbi:hypothetical protein B0O80DRAFT_497955 [Mortierella sp. GBAus27b]|nr:hypothetical protein B0O80DRAFT_497955 [Mortierella sp. GBAus27b]
MPQISPWRSRALATAKQRNPYGRNKTRQQDQGATQKHVPASPGSPQGVSRTETHVSPVAAMATITMPVNNARKWLVRRTGPSPQRQHHKDLVLQPEQQPQGTRPQLAPQPLMAHGPQPQVEPWPLPAQECSEQQLHEVPSSEDENVQHSPTAAQDGPSGSSDLGWVIYEDSTDQEPSRPINPQSGGSQHFERVDRIPLDNKSRKTDLGGMGKKDDSDNASDDSPDKENVPSEWHQEVEHQDEFEEHPSQGGSSFFKPDSFEEGTWTQFEDDGPQSPIDCVIGSTSSSAPVTGVTRQLLLEVVEREEELKLELQDLNQLREEYDRRLEGYELHFAELESVRGRLRDAVLAEERQAQAHGMSRKRKWAEDEDQTRDAKVARARVGPQQAWIHPMASTSSSHHLSRQAQATSRPGQRCVSAWTSVWRQQHPRDRVQALAPSQHYDQPQEHVDGQVLGEAEKSPSRLGDEEPEENGSHADDHDSVVLATCSSQDEQDEDDALYAGYGEDDDMSASTYQHLYETFADEYKFGPIYSDATYEYRNVTLPKALLSRIQPDLKLHPRTHDHTLKFLSGGMAVPRGQDVTRLGPLRKT